MAMSSPRLVALSFYDGPTEGFIRGIGGDLVHFFKVVAWDEGQNRRLYLLGQVEVRIFEQLLATLAAPEQPTPGGMWTPIWKFQDIELEARANSAVEEGRSSLAAPAILALGESLLDDFEIVIPTEAQLVSAQALAHAGWPGNLSDWLALGS